MSGNTVYIGGSFDSITNSTGTGTVARNYAAAVDAVHGYDTGWAPDPEDNGPDPGQLEGVYALLVSGSTIYLGGSFYTVTNSTGTGTVTDPAVAAVDAVSGYALNPGIHLGGAVDALALSNGILYAGDGNSNGGLSALDLDTHQQLQWHPSISQGGIRALLASGANLYLGGGFTQVDGLEQSDIAQLTAPIPHIGAWQRRGTLSLEFAGSYRPGSSASSVRRWSWSFGDGATSTLRNPRHAYARPGTYTVTLAITDWHGGTSQVSRTIHVHPATSA